MSAVTDPQSRGRCEHESPSYQAVVARQVAVYEFTDELEAMGAEAMISAGWVARKLREALGRG